MATTIAAHIRWEKKAEKAAWAVMMRPAKDGLDIQIDDSVPKVIYLHNEGAAHMANTCKYYTTTNDTWTFDIDSSFLPSP